MSDVPPASRLHEFGQADAYGCFSLAAGALTVVVSFTCCVGPTYEEEEALFFYALLLAGALWCGAFGVVMRGSPAGRNLAQLGLVFAAGSVAVSAVALCLNGF